MFQIGVEKTGSSFFRRSLVSVSFDQREAPMRKTLARWLRGIATWLAPEPGHACLEESYHQALLESMDKANALGADNDRLQSDPLSHPVVREWLATKWPAHHVQFTGEQIMIYLARERHQQGPSIDVDELACYIAGLTGAQIPDSLQTSDVMRAVAAFTNQAQPRGQG